MLRDTRHILLKQPKNAKRFSHSSGRFPMLSSVSTLCQLGEVTYTCQQYNMQLDNFLRWVFSQRIRWAWSLHNISSANAVYTLSDWLVRGLHAETRQYIWWKHPIICVCKLATKLHISSPNVITVQDVYTSVARGTLTAVFRRRSSPASCWVAAIICYAHVLSGSYPLQCRCLQPMLSGSFVNMNDKTRSL